MGNLGAFYEVNLNHKADIRALNGQKLLFGVCCLKSGHDVEIKASRLNPRPSHWDLGLEAGDWAFRLVLRLGLGAEIWALRLGLGL